MVNEVLSLFPEREDYLIEILLTLQKKKKDHAFTQEELTTIANHLEIPSSRVSSVVSFYTFFSMKSKGKYVIQVCKDVPCYLNDSFDLLKTLKKELGIEVGETTSDGLFTLEQTSCLGCCDSSPAIRVKETVFGNLTKNKVKVLLSNLNGDDHD
jgi:NADH-quinone oxidoreductase subunit E